MSNKEQYPDLVRAGALVRINIMSIYNNYTAPLPKRMAWMTLDAAEGLEILEQKVNQAGGKIFLSDAFRSEHQQAMAHFDYLTGHKRFEQRDSLVTQYPFLVGYRACNGGKGKLAFSPPPGGSVHEAGRAIDADLSTQILGIDQFTFANIAYSCGWCNIVGGPSGMGDPTRVDVKEEWHWEFRGAFEDVYSETLAETGNHSVAYKAMVRAMILDIH